MNFFKMLGGGLKAVAIAKVNEEAGRIHDDIDEINNHIKRELLHARSKHMNDVDALIDDITNIVNTGADKSHRAINRGTSRIINKIDRI